MTSDDSTHSDEPGLPRFLGPLGATLFVVCYTVGTAIFLVPGIVARNAGSMPASLAVWVIGGLLSLCGALAYAELAVRVPQSGAEYRYLYAGYGPKLAFVFAWTCLFTQPVAMAAVARGFADYLAQLWPLDEVQRRAVATAAIGVCAAVAVRSTPLATRLAGLAAIGKLLALLTVAGIGIWVSSGPASVTAPPTSSWHWAQWAPALVAVIWAYDGMASIAIIAGEVREPRRTLPISLIASIGIIVVVYLMMNLAYFKVLGFNGVATSDAVAAATLRTTIGPAGAAMVAAMVMTSALGTTAATLVGNPRFFVAPAEDGLFPSRLAAISPRTLTPVNAILLAAGIGVGVLTAGGYELLIRLYVLGYYPLVVVALLAAVRLRRRDGRPTGFAMPLYPLPLLLYGVCILGICVASALEDPLGALCGLFIPLTGALAYRFKVRRGPELRAQRH